MSDEASLNMEAEQSETPTLDMVEQAAPTEEINNVAEEPQKTAPEQYEAFNLPEDVEHVPEMEEGFRQIAKEWGLSQEAAQKGVDWFMEQSKLQRAKAMEAQEEYVETLKKETMEDPELGGAKWKGDAEISVRLAMDKLGTPELKKLIADNPALAVHKEIIRVFKRAGDLLREGKVVEARTGIEPPRAADVLFDKT